MEYRRTGDYVHASIEGTPEEVAQLIAVIQRYPIGEAEEKAPA